MEDEENSDSGTAGRARDEEGERRSERTGRREKEESGRGLGRSAVRLINTDTVCK